MFTLRFDMRAPGWGAPDTDLYAAAIDMCAWVETRGGVLAVLSEHHGADDVDQAWDELGPHLLHDATMAASYRPDDDSVASITRADTVEALRDQVGPYRIFTSDEATGYVRGGRPLPLHPLCGGIAPDVAWPI